MVELNDSSWWLCMLSFIGLAIGLNFFRKSRQGQILIDRFLVSGPMVSRLTNKIYTTELLRILGNLIESKVPLLDALDVTRGAIRNLFFRNFVDKITRHVEQGGKFSHQFATYPYILDSVKQMVATGEEVGNLSKTMLRLTSFYDVEVEHDLKKLSTKIEPVALLIMGTVVGIITLQAQMAFAQAGAGYGQRGAGVLSADRQASPTVINNNYIQDSLAARIILEQQRQDLLQSTREGY